MQKKNPSSGAYASATRLTKILTTSDTPTLLGDVVHRFCDYIMTMVLALLVVDYLYYVYRTFGICKTPVLSMCCLSYLESLMAMTIKISGYLNLDRWCLCGEVKMAVHNCWRKLEFETPELSTVEVEETALQ